MDKRVLRTCYEKQHFVNAIRPFVDEFTGRLAETHDHPESAALRNAAAQAITSACNRLGLSQHVIQPANREVSNAITETTRFHWLRDLTRVYKADKLLKDSMITMVDVDYYIDMPAVLSAGLPVLIYTMIPEKAADRQSDYCYRFEGDEIIADSGHGVVYKHQLWDYQVDQVTGANKHTITLFDVFRLRLAENRYFVGFVPKLRLPVMACLSSVKYPPSLRRRRLGTGKVTALPSIADPTKLSLALQGPHAYDSIALEVEVVLCVARRLRAILAKMKSIDLSDTARYLENIGVAKGKDAQVAALVLVTYVESDLVVVEGIDSYTAAGDGDGVAPGAVFAPSLTQQPALAAVRAPAQDRATVANRVLAVTNRARPPPCYERWAVEFVNRLVPNEHAHRGRPLDLRDVMERQARPMQQMRNLKAGPWHVVDFEVERIAVRAFQKAEAYGAVKAARNISQVPVDHTLALSGYVLAMKEAVLKSHSWFGPGRTPAEITDVVSDITAAGNVVGRDFTNFDGTVSEWIFSNVIVPGCMRWTAHEEALKMRALLTAEVNARCKTKYGVRYSNGYGRLSGSPTTSDHNTIINAFVSYAGYRAAGLSSSRAWESLGVYYGDDSLETYPPEMDKDMQSAVDALGFTVKIERLPGPTYPFLGRYFGPSWSFADPWRTMAKLHAAFGHSDQADIMLANRVAGYLVTDARTPIIGVWCHRVMEILAERGVVPKMSSMERDDWWRCTEAWPQEGLDDDAFNAVTGMTTAEVTEVEDLIMAAATLDALPTIPGTSHRGFVPRSEAPGFYVNSDPTPSAPVTSSIMIATDATTTASTATTAATTEPIAVESPTAAAKPTEQQTTASPPTPQVSAVGVLTVTASSSGGDGAEVQPVCNRCPVCTAPLARPLLVDRSIGSGGGQGFRQTDENQRRRRRPPRNRLVEQTDQPVRQVPVRQYDTRVATGGQPFVHGQRGGLVRPQPVSNNAGQLRQRQRQLPRPSPPRSEPGRVGSPAGPVESPAVVYDRVRQPDPRSRGHSGSPPGGVVRHPGRGNQGVDAVHPRPPVDRVPARPAEPNLVVAHDGVARSVHYEALRRRRQRQRQRRAEARRASAAPAAATTGE